MNQLVLVLTLIVASMMIASAVDQTTGDQRVAKLEARVAKLEATLVELRGNIKEYHFSTAAGDFVCMRCRIEEEKK